MNSEIVLAIARKAIEEYKGVQGFLEYDPIQTTDATPTTIATIEIEEYSSGILEVEVIGVDDTGTGNSVTGKRIVRFKKTTTLTLGTPANILAIQTDIVGATFSIAASSENIIVQVTGAASTNINWVCKIRVNQVIATTLP